MKTINIQINEQAGIARKNEFVRLGVPLLEGQVTEAKQLFLQTENIDTPCQFKPLTYWPDGSLRWVLASFQTTLEANQTNTFELIKSEKRVNNTTVDQEIKVEQRQQELEVQTGTHLFLISQTKLQWQSEKTHCTTSIQFTDIDKQPCQAKLDTHGK